MVAATSAASETRLLLSPPEDVAGTGGDTRARQVTRGALRAVLGSLVLGAVAATVFSESRGVASDAFATRLGAEQGGTCAFGFVDDLPETPAASTFLRAMPTLSESVEAPSHYARCAGELTSLPVVTSNDAYRLGNAVERQGVGWIGARRLVLDDEKGYEGSILYNYLMNESEEQRSFVSCVVGHKKALEARGVPLNRLHGDDKTIVIPLRLSDKVRFMVEDYPVINTAVVEYKKKYCPQCTDLVIMTLLVWGEDKNHMFAYNDEEYKQSLTVLRSIAKRAQTEEGGNLRVTVRSTLNADDDFVYSAYSPHLVLPLVTPSSWHQLLTYSNRAVFDPAREQAAEKHFDTVIQPKLAMPGRRQRLLNVYKRLEARVPGDVLVNWFQLEVKRRGLDEHAVTVTDMDKWNDWNAIIAPYEVGMGAYDGAVRSIAHSRERAAERRAPRVEDGHRGSADAGEDEADAADAPGDAS